MTPTPVVHELYSKIEKFVARRVQNPQDREDLIQDILLKMGSGLKSLKNEDRMMPWLYRTARNRVIDFYRAKTPSGSLGDISLPEEGEENINREVASWLRPFIGSMNNEDQEILTLIELEGLTQREAALRLKLSRSAAKSRHQRAKKRLRGLIQACCQLYFDSLGNITGYSVKNKACSCS